MLKMHTESIDKLHQNYSKKISFILSPCFYSHNVVCSTLRFVTRVEDVIAIYVDKVYLITYQIPCSRAI